MLGALPARTQRISFLTTTDPDHDVLGLVLGLGRRASEQSHRHQTATKNRIVESHDWTHSPKVDARHCRPCLLLLVPTLIAKCDTTAMKSRNWLRFPARATWPTTSRFSFHVLRQQRLCPTYILDPPFETFLPLPPIQNDTSRIEHSFSSSYGSI